MNPNDLIEGEYYWIKDADGELQVGRFYWTYVTMSGRPCFHTCGEELGELFERVTVLERIEKPNERNEK